MSEDEEPSEKELRFDHFQVLDDEEGGGWTLARGAFDVTYKAVDTLLECPVALRVLDAESAGVGDVGTAFLAEAKLAAALHHSGIATALALGRGTDQPYVAFEFVKGEGLESLLAKTGPLSPSAALGIGAQIASILHALWQAGLAHPSLGIASFTLFYECEEMRLKLTDVRLCKAGAKSRLTRIDEVYQSPEQKSGAAPDIRSNLYSTGKVICRLLGASVEDLELMDRPDGVANCGALRALPKGVSELISKLVATDPAKRVQTPFDLRSLIARCRADAPSAPVEARTATDAETARPAPAISQRFHPGRPLDGGVGRFSECNDSDTGETVVVHFFSADEEVSRIEVAQRVAKALLDHPHDHILKPVELSPDDAERLLAYEDAGSRRLLDSLRRQRKLLLAESLQLLDQLASAVDHAVEFGIDPIPLTPATIRLNFEKGAEGVESDGWSAIPLSKLPGLVGKIVPFGALPDAEFAYNSIAAVDAKPDDLKERMMREFGWLIHELLGGARPRVPIRTAAAFVPLASLSEAGNTALKRVLFPGESQPFGSAGAFVNELRSTTELDVVPTPAPQRPRAAAPAPYAESISTPASKRPPVVVSDEWRDESQRISSGWLLAAVSVLILLVAGVLFVLGDGFGLVAPGIRNQVQSVVPFELPDLGKLLAAPAQIPPVPDPTPDPTPEPTPAGTPTVIQMPLPSQPGG